MASSIARGSRRKDSATPSSTAARSSASPTRGPSSRNCNAHLRQVADAVKRGVWSAGGFPLEFPTISLGEVLMKPTDDALQQPDGDGRRGVSSAPTRSTPSVLLSGCDKTTPAMLMGAASADVPADHGHRRAHAAAASGAPRSSARAPTPGALGRSGARGVLTDEELCEAGVVHVALEWPLHGHGHRLDDGVDRRRRSA